MEPLNATRTTRVIRNRSAKLLVALMLTLALVLAGCSGGEEGDGSGQSGQSGGSGDSGGASETAREAQPTTGDTTAAVETTAEETAEETMMAAPEETQEASGDSGEGSDMSTALSGGLETAQREAESWNQDAKLYAVASLRPTVNAEGESRGWLYSFVSESEGSVISIPYSGGEARGARGQELPEDQIERISATTLSVEDLVDSQKAMERSDEVQGYLEENPQAGASAGLDSASREEPEWILSVPAQALQNRVSATE